MIYDDDVPELGGYRALEEKVDVAMRDEWSALAVFGKNEQTPVHNWFRFKEGFSADLLGTILTEFEDKFGASEIRMLDPFCGVGTALLSSQLHHGKVIHATGIERNPFIRFVASTKLRWADLFPGTLVSDGLKALELSLDVSPHLPALSSIRKGRCISRHVASRLMAIDEAAQKFPGTSDFLRLGVASAIEPLSCVRRDGRALRIVDKPVRRVGAFLEKIWTAMADDVTRLQRLSIRKPSHYPVLNGDGRDPLSAGVEEQSIDLILTSPPYPNNIDYSEVYKLELWMLGFVSSSADFLALRRSTLRSHPTFEKKSKPPQAFEHELRKGKLRRVLGDLVERLADSKENWRSRMLSAYFGDLWTALDNYKRILSRNGIAVFVVGNSLHGTDKPALVATDLILAKIAECQGLSARINVVRNLKRRLSGNHFLRESIVVVQRTDGKQ
jgi:hypothetical protein